MQPSPFSRHDDDPLGQLGTERLILSLQVLDLGQQLLPGAVDEKRENGMEQSRHGSDDRLWRAATGDDRVFAHRRSGQDSRMRERHELRVRDQVARDLIDQFEP